MLRADALTFDFYQTLVRHRGGTGRGAALMELFAREGIASDPWEHQVLYDVFECHGREYDPGDDDGVKDSYRCRLAERVFARLHANAQKPAAVYASRIWDVLGPSSLEVFPDVIVTLERLKRAGYPMAVVSNWQHGLANFLVELDLRGWFDHVVVSVEVGLAKPDAGIFREACRRLGMAPERVLHVGDALIDDWEGGRAAGLQVVLVDRGGESGAADATTIASLDELRVLLRLK